MFSGYGSQWPGMAQRLLTTEPAFAEAVDRLEPLIQRHAGLSLRAHLRPDAELDMPSVVQPVLFGIQVALAELWRSHGLEPAAVIGHSMGEVAAAVAAGALDIDTGARVIATRSWLLDSLSGGAMAVIGLSETDVLTKATGLDSVQIAVHSSPGQCVVTGTTDDIHRLVQDVTAEGGLARVMPAGGAAGHSPRSTPSSGLCGGSWAPSPTPSPATASTPPSRTTPATRPPSTPTTGPPTSAAPSGSPRR